MSRADKSHKHVGKMIPAGLRVVLNPDGVTIDCIVKYQIGAGGGDPYDVKFTLGKKGGRIVGVNCTEDSSRNVSSTSATEFHGVAFDSDDGLCIRYTGMNDIVPVTVTVDDTSISCMTVETSGGGALRNHKKDEDGTK